MTKHAKTWGAPPKDFKLYNLVLNENKGTKVGKRDGVSRLGKANSVCFGSNGKDKCLGLSCKEFLPSVERSVTPFRGNSKRSHDTGPWAEGGEANPGLSTSVSALLLLR